MTHSRKCAIAACAIAASALVWAGKLAPVRIEPDRYLAHVKYLASDEMKGRATGSAELDKAARYIAREFESLGLRPITGGSYFQEFPVTVNAKIGPRNRLKYALDGQESVLKAGEDFLPLNFSARGSFHGGVVFAGYGITAPEYGYDDFAGLDVRDKFVLIMRHEPQEFDEQSPFAGRIYTEHAQTLTKALTARMHGALGIIMVSDLAGHAGSADELDPFIRSLGPGDTGIPCVQVKWSIAEAWVHSAGKDLRKIAGEIDGDLQPRSFPLDESLRVALEVDVKRQQRNVRNVAAYAPGETEKFVAVGAHYDHLGLGELYSMAPGGEGKPHPGADDNASGTAGVLELARHFSSQPRRTRGALFLAFAGEEVGLLGSSQFVRSGLAQMGGTVAMVNLDMIGRIRENAVTVGGANTSRAFREMVERLATPRGLHLEFNDRTGYGSSDHNAFLAREVPVLFFFSGLHADYHRPTDTWEKINAEGAANLLGLVAEVMETLMEAPEQPGFLRSFPRSATAAVF